MFNINDSVLRSIGLVLILIGLVLILVAGLSYHRWISRKTNDAKQRLRLREAARRQLEL